MGANMKVIQSVQNEFIKSLDKLNDKKIRNSKKTFLVEGYHLVNEAYNHNALEAVLSISEKDFKNYLNVEHYLVNEAIIKKLTKTMNPQGIIGVVKMPSFSLVDLSKKDLKLVLLESINDPGNLGSIIRTAAALGYDAIYMSTDTVDIYNEKALRATQGAIFKIPFYYVQLDFLITKLKENDIICFGTNLKNAISIESIEKAPKYSICFGNEARGMSEELSNMMNKNIMIPMTNKVESLNVLSASSIVMYVLKNR